MKALFELDLALPEKGSRQATRSLYEQLQAAIVERRLAPGTRLPAGRSARALFGVARNTLSEVYQKLLNEGYVVARHGSGTYVADELPGQLARAPGAGADLAAARLNPIWRRPDIVEPMRFWREGEGEAGQGAAVADLRPALVDPRLFPFDVFRRLMGQQLRALENKRPALFRSPQGNQGNYVLRQAITRHIAVTRAVASAEDDIIVTSGAQQAFDLLARVLVVPGETVVAVEDPGYPPLRAAFAAAGARVVGVRVDAEGLVVAELPDDAAVVCLTPSHQFPLGVTMTAQRRAALLAWSRRHSAVIVEDDYDGEFRLDGASLAALRTESAADLVFYVGTFSKCMLPTLRLGFIVAPEWSREALVTAKNCLDWHCPTAMQMAVAAFIADGHLTRHVRSLRQTYRIRRRLILDALRTNLAPWLTPIPSAYGMHVTALVQPGVDPEQAVARMTHAGVNLHSLERYYLGAPRQQGLVFGYGAAGPTELAQALQLLEGGFAREE